MIDPKYAYDLTSCNGYPSVIQPNFFTLQECQSIIDIGLGYPAIESYIGDEKSIDSAIRKNRVVFFESKQDAVQWIFQKTAQGILSINHQFWQFDLSCIETLQFTIYDRVADFYTAHMDMAHGKTPQRKLSFSVQLSDPASYVGGDLEFHSVGDRFYPASRDQGTMTLFPSYMIHRVTPITHGTRYSLVGWIVGPPFK